MKVNIILYKNINNNNSFKGIYIEMNYLKMFINYNLIKY